MSTITLYKLYHYTADYDDGRGRESDYPEPLFYRHEENAKRGRDSRNAELLAAENASRQAALNAEHTQRCRAREEHNALVRAGLRSTERPLPERVPFVPSDKLGRWTDHWGWEQFDIEIQDD